MDSTPLCVFTYSEEMTGTPNGDAPSIIATSYNFKADSDHRSSEARAGRHQESQDSHTQQSGERVASELGRGWAVKTLGLQTK